MASVDESLDFELDDLFTSPLVPTKKRKKVIGLDDLLSDYYKEKSRIIDKESKQAKVQKSYSSDEDSDDREAKVSKCVADFHKEMGQIGGEDEMSLWGLQVFGNQKPLPPLACPGLASCTLLKSCMNQEINSLIGLSTEKCETFLEELLVDGWLLKLSHICGHVEKPLALWTFNLLLHSSSEVLRTSASDFWCAILSPKNKKHLVSIKVGWLPGYSAVKAALEVYGFILDKHDKYSSDMEIVHSDLESLGPPQNIRVWIKYVATCCQVRNVYSIFSTSEVEELVIIVIFLFLERQLIGLSMILREALLSAINFFTDKEWITSCNNIAKSMACSVPKNINCVRAVESISGVDPRSKQLRTAMAFQFLKACFNDQDLDMEEIIRLLISINVKEKDCDLFKMFVCLCLTENWILCNPILENSLVIKEMWGVFLRSCSCQITTTDMRAYASKVRSKASYLLQETSDK